MKRILLIGMALLFSIAQFTVKAGYSTPIIVDDDVGISVALDLGVTMPVEINADNCSQVAAPIKFCVNPAIDYSCYTSEITMAGQYRLTTDCYLSCAHVQLMFVTKLKDQYDLNFMLCLSDLMSSEINSQVPGNAKLPSTVDNWGLYRLDIGEQRERIIVI